MEQMEEGCCPSRRETLVAPLLGVLCSGKVCVVLQDSLQDPDSPRLPEPRDCSSFSFRDKDLQMVSPLAREGCP